MGIDRNRSVTPRSASCRHRVHRVADAEGHRHHEHPGQQELHVAAAARDDHRATEQQSVEGNQHDQERRAADHGQRLADPVVDAAQGQRPGVGHHPAQPGQRRIGRRGHRHRGRVVVVVVMLPPRWSCRCGPRPGVPVSAMKTSSSVGRRTATSSAVMPADGERREDLAHRRTRSETGALTRRMSRFVSAVPPAARSTRAAAAGRSEASRTIMSTRSPPICDLSCSGAPFGDHPAVVDHADAVGQLVRLVQVLRGQHRRSCRLRRAVGWRPTPRSGRADRARWWARPGTGPRAPGSGWPPDRGAGACRPSTA